MVACRYFAGIVFYFADPAFCFCPVACAERLLPVPACKSSAAARSNSPATAIADAEPDLERVLGPIDELTRIWRVLAAPDRRQTPRVAAFFDFVVDEIEALRPILTG